jgi:hypothetical protein
MAVTLSIITNNTGYVTFDQYDQSTGTLSNTWDIPKINVSSIHTYYKEMTEDKLGIVVITTITLMEPNAKNALLTLNPTVWALSSASTTPIADAATLRTALLGYFSTKW